MSKETEAYRELLRFAIDELKTHNERYGCHTTSPAVLQLLLHGIYEPEFAMKGLKELET